MMQTTIHAEVDRATKTAIQQLAKDNRVSVSVVVRWALLEYLKREAWDKPRQERSKP